MTIAALTALSDQELRRKLGVSQKRLAGLVRPVLDALKRTPEGVTLTPDTLAAEIGCTTKQVNDALADIVAVDFSVFDKTSGYLPSTAAMIELLERRLGPIDSSNLSAANGLCTSIVEAAVLPRYESFIRRELAKYLDAAGASLTIPISDLLEHLRGNYREFVKAQDNGLVARAGGYNEAIFRRLMVNGQLVEGTDFGKTGTKSHGDFAFYCRTLTPQRTLYAEVKSYGARERLLRGLQDAPAPKIGVGFFTEPSEFNPRRTQDYLDTQALAIYVPQSTLEQIAPAALARVNGRNAAFYRPLEQLLPDAKDFIRRGEDAYS